MFDTNLHISSLLCMIKMLYYVRIILTFDVIMLFIFSCYSTIGAMMQKEYISFPKCTDANSIL